MKVVYSSEVAAARRKGVPLVALESSVIAQGLPAPHNLTAATRCEAAIRGEGAVPATIAVIDGELWVGLEPHHFGASLQGAAAAQDGLS